jgi:DNA-binding transcriptional MerR regulator
MRMSELAGEAGLPVATVKYYLREGLLHEGQRTSQTQAVYDATHLERLRLVRALVGPAGQSIASTRRILAAIGDPPSEHDLLGIAHQAVTPALSSPASTPRAVALLERLGWDATQCAPDSLRALEQALDALDAGGFELPDATIDRYATAMMAMAEEEVADVPTDSAEAAARFVILGTVLVEPLLLSLRRLAQQSASARRFG